MCCVLCFGVQRSCALRSQQRVPLALLTMSGGSRHMSPWIIPDARQRLRAARFGACSDLLINPDFRLKVDGFASVNGENNANVFSSTFMAADLNTLGDVMAGYQLNWDRIWVKLYAGAAHQVQTLAFWQAGQVVQQKSYGATAAVETFWQGSSGFWASGNLSWLQFDNTASFYGRIAYKIMHENEGLNLSVGAETGAMIKNANSYREGKRLDLYNEYVREGALLNLRYGSNDLTISGGFASASDEATWRPYATISYGKKF